MQAPVEASTSAKSPPDRSPDIILQGGGESNDKPTLQRLQVTVPVPLQRRQVAGPRCSRDADCTLRYMSRRASNVRYGLR